MFLDHVMENIEQYIAGGFVKFNRFGFCLTRPATAVKEYAAGSDEVESSTRRSLWLPRRELVRAPGSACYSATRAIRFRLKIPAGSAREFLMRIEPGWAEMDPDVARASVFAACGLRPPVAWQKRDEPGVGASVAQDVPELRDEIFAVTHPWLR